MPYMRGRTWAIVIAASVLLSAAVVVVFLLASGRLPGQSSPTKTVVPATLTQQPALATTVSSDGPGAESQTAGDEIPATPTTLVHTVVQGDTLTGIALTYGTSVDALVELNQLANPDLLRLGQELLIPAAASALPETYVAPTGSPAAATVATDPVVATDVDLETQPAPTPADVRVPTLTSSGPPLIEIAQVLGSGVLADEVVLIRNRGGAGSLESWTLSDGDKSLFIFPALTLYPGSEVRLHSRSGTNQPTDLYWGLVEAAWQGGALATLRDAAGEVVDTYIVP